MMKKIHVLAFIAVLGLSACEKKTTSEKIGDAVEAVKDDAAEAGSNVKDSVKEGAEKLEDAVEGK